MNNASIKVPQYRLSGNNIIDLYINVPFETTGYVKVGGTLNVVGATTLKDTLTVTQWIKSNGIIQGSSFNATSDKRLKENIKPFVYGESILNLPICTFDFKGDGPKNQIGCLAQDLQKICPELVHEDEKGFLSIQESKLVYLLLEEIKRLKERVDELEKR